MQWRGELHGDALGPLSRIGERRAKAFAAVGKVMEEAKDEVFRNEGAPRDPWKKLSPRRIGERKGMEHPILNWSGRLQESYKASVPAEGDHEMSLGSDLFYARTHQEGWAAAPDGPVPARSILLPEDAKDRMISVFIEEILGN